MLMKSSNFSSSCETKIVVAILFGLRFGVTALLTACEIQESWRRIVRQPNGAKRAERIINMSPSEDTHGWMRLFLRIPHSMHWTQEVYKGKTRLQMFFNEVYISTVYVGRTDLSSRNPGNRNELPPNWYEQYAMDPNESFSEIRFRYHDPNHFKILCPQNAVIQVIQKSRVREISVIHLSEDPMYNEQLKKLRHCLPFRQVVPRSAEHVIVEKRCFMNNKNKG